jgi:DNA-binding CsgD family transcriptional regulator
MLIAARNGFEHPFEALGIEELEVGPLAAAAAERLLQDQVPDLEPAMRSTLLREAAGNPLALTELAPLVPDDTRLSMLPAQLPLTERLEGAFSSRLEDLARVERVLLLACAADGVSALSEALAAASSAVGEEVTVSVLDRAIADGLVRTELGVVQFQHPLLRSVAYRSAALSDRMAVHAGFARVLEGDPDRGAWHQAAATLGPDERVAEVLEAAATRARRRGALTLGMAALERAAELSESDDGRTRRVLGAAELAFELGHPSIVEPLLTSLRGIKVDAIARGRVARLQELVTRHPYTASRCRRLIDTSREVQAAGDRELALEILWLAGSRCWWQDPGRDARDAVEDATLEIAGLDDFRVLSVMAYASPFSRGAAIVKHLEEAVQRSDPSPKAAFLYGTAAISAGAWDVGTELLSRNIAELRIEGRLGDLPRPLVQHAWVATRMADWGTALPLIDEARKLGDEVRQPVWLAAAESVAALAAAMRGEDERSALLADRAEQLAEPLGASFVLTTIQIARGAAALNAGEPNDAYDALIRPFRDGDPAAHWVMRWWGVGDLVESALQSGSTESVLPIVEHLERHAHQTPALSVQTELHRVRSLLAPDAEMDRVYEEALTCDLRRWPFDRARLLFNLGKRLRRQRRVAECRPPLRTAREVFAAIGARGWSERARQELRASGETSRSREPESRDELTPQELQIAQLAASGRTNREIGRQLYLSHRTVGTHLYRIFPKLGITSRTQLSAALSEHGQSAGDAQPREAQKHLQPSK